MTDGIKTNADDAANPLKGEAPAPDEVQDDTPRRQHPNAFTHSDGDPKWKARPGQYPAAKAGLLDTDIPDADGGNG